MLLYRFFTNQNNWEIGSNTSKTKSQNTREDKEYLIFEDKYDKTILYHNFMKQESKKELDYHIISVDDNKIRWEDRDINWLTTEKVSEFRVDWEKVFTKTIYLATDESPNLSYWNRKNFVLVEDWVVMQSNVKKMYEFHYSEGDQNSQKIKKAITKETTEHINSLKKYVKQWTEVTNFTPRLFILYKSLSNKEFLRFSRNYYEVLKSANEDYNELWNDFDQLPRWTRDENWKRCPALFTKDWKLSKNTKKVKEFNERRDEILSRLDYKYVRLDCIDDEVLQKLEAFIKIAKEDQKYWIE